MPALFSTKEDTEMIAALLAFLGLALSWLVYWGG